MGQLKGGHGSLCRGGGDRRGGRGFGGYFRGGDDGIDLHSRQDLFEAVEDLVAVDVLGDALIGGHRGDVQGKFVAGSILESMEVLRVALASSFTGDGFGGAELEVAEHQLGS